MINQIKLLSILVLYNFPLTFFSNSLDALLALIFGELVYCVSPETDLTFVSNFCKPCKNKPRVVNLLILLTNELPVTSKPDVRISYSNKIRSFTGLNHGTA